jgi:hypothetical protein
VAKRSRFLRFIPPIYVIINIGGGVIALAQGEMMHAAAHGAALLVGYLIWQAFDFKRSDRQAAAIPDKVDLHLDDLQQSVDKLAIHVERMGENQRFVQKVLEKRSEPPPASN